MPIHEHDWLGNRRTKARVIATANTQAKRHHFSKFGARKLLSEESGGHCKSDLRRNVRNLYVEIGDHYLWRRGLRFLKGAIPLDERRENPASIGRLKHPYAVLLIADSRIFVIERHVRSAYWLAMLAAGRFHSMYSPLPP